MNNKEILHMAENEKKDEGMQQAEAKGRRIGEIAFSLVFIFIIIFNLCTEHDNNAPFAMFWAFAAASAYPKYQFTKQKSYLVITISGSVVSLASLINLVLTNVR